MRQIRLTSEKKYNFKDINIKIGTTNRLMPEVIYLESSLYVIPLFDNENYDKEIKKLRYFLKKNITNILNKKIFNKNIFKKEFLFDVDTPINYYKYNKKSFFKISFFFRQNGYNTIKDLYEILEEEIKDYVYLLFNKLKEMNFSYSKTKK